MPLLINFTYKKEKYVYVHAYIYIYITVLAIPLILQNHVCVANKLETISMQTHMR